MLNYMIRATLEGVFQFPPTAIAASIGLIVGIGARVSSDVRFRLHELLLGLPVLFTTCLILHGAVFSLEYAVAMEANWKTRLIELILILHFVSAGLTIWLLKGLRIYATGILVFLSCFVLIAAFEAYMSVTNRWL